MVYLLVRYHIQCNEFGCSVMTPLGVFTNLSKAKSERARLNKLRKVEIERRAPSLVGNEYLEFVPRRGYSMLVHNRESSLTYAGYDVPTFGIVEVSTDVVINDGSLFEAEGGG